MRPTEFFLLEGTLAREKKNSHRSLRSFEGADFFSNDYLGYSRNTSIIGKYQRKILQLDQLGATGSRLLGGQNRLHQSVEKTIASLFQSEEALLFSSGYLANLGLIQCTGVKRTIVMDELCHNSMKNGAKLSGSKTLFFRHNNLEHLERRIKENPGSLILVESVYSMDGDLAPLKEIVSLARQYRAEVIVDEAHAAGVLGPKGKGLVIEEGLEDQILARVITFGKAFGAEGAAVLGTNHLKDFLINFCQSFIYTTGVSLPTLLMLESALEYFSISTKEIENLHANIRAFAEVSGKKMSSPIFPWHVPGCGQARMAATRLQGEMLAVYPVLPPSVRQGTERLRIVLHAFNTDDDIRRLADMVKKHEQ